MNEAPAMNLRCVVERITYQNPENGYSVLKVRVKGYGDLVTLVGNLLEVPVGSVLLCRGEWKVDKRYGRQFVAATWKETMPATVYGIEKYLGSGLVKGIGPRFARAIVPEVRNGNHRHHRDRHRTALRSPQHRTQARGEDP